MTCPSISPVEASHQTFEKKSLRPHGLVFIDSAVEDYELLLNGLNPNLQATLLNPQEDSILQITETLKGLQGLTSLHIVAHGCAGTLMLGDSRIDSNTLYRHRQDLEIWANALTSNAVILLYGCCIASGEMGQQFVNRLHQLTGANVAASTQVIGTAALGGCWELDVQLGERAVPLAFNPTVLASYPHTL